MEGDISVCSLASSSAKSGPSVEKRLPKKPLPELLEAFEGLRRPRSSYYRNPYKHFRMEGERSFIQDLFKYSSIV